MATLTEVREGLAEALGSISGLQVSPHALSNPSLPSASVVPREFDYHQTFGDGPSDWYFNIEVLAALVSDIGAQLKLDSFLEASGDTSILAAVEADPTLGGRVSDTTVQGVRDYGPFARATGDPVLGARVLVWVVN